MTRGSEYGDDKSLVCSTNLPNGDVSAAFDISVPAVDQSEPADTSHLWGLRN